MANQTKVFFEDSEVKKVEYDVKSRVLKDPTMQTWRSKPEDYQDKIDRVTVVATVRTKCDAILYDNGDFILELRMDIGQEDKNVHGWVVDVKWTGGDDRKVTRHESPRGMGYSKTEFYDDFVIGFPPTAQNLLDIIKPASYGGTGLMVQRIRYKGNSHSIRKETAVQFPQGEATKVFTEIVTKHSRDLIDAVKYILEWRKHSRASTSFNTIHDAVQAPGEYLLLHRQHAYKFKWSIEPSREYSSGGFGDGLKFTVVLENTKLGEKEHGRSKGGSFYFNLKPMDNGAVGWSWAGHYETEIVKDRNFDQFLDLEELLARHSSILPSLIMLLGENGFDEWVVNYQKALNTKLKEIGLIITRSSTPQTNDESIVSKARAFLEESEELEILGSIRRLT